jgi:hypothetical protein
MTIQIPNPGTGNGATGDNEFVLWSKVKSNFEDQANAASRLVGTDDEQIPTAKQSYKSAFGSINTYYSRTTNKDCNSLELGTRVLFSSDNPNAPPTNAGTVDYYIETIFNYSTSTALQLAWGYNYPVLYIRTRWNDAWSPWISASATKETYNTTTASGANVVVGTTGQLMRSTSSERYKEIIADLELDDVAYANAMQLAPIVYRSTAEADNPNYHYYSFSAEALGAYDPAFTLWRDTETVTDDEGNTSERPLDERQAEGINLNAIVAFLHATNVKQGKLIAEQAEAIETLTKRIDDITVE